MVDQKLHPTAPQPGQSQEFMQHKYSLNSVNQTKRLIESSNPPPMEIKYSNQQMIKGRRHPTSVSIDCNAGVYLSAVKPVLEEIDTGWTHDLMDTTVTCEEVSHRKDISGRKVCTKLVLYLSEQCSPLQRAKIVLH